MIKHYALIKKDNEELILKRLIEIFGVPQIKKRLNIYARNAEGKEIQLFFNNNQLFFKLNSKEPEDGFVQIKNRNIKYFIKDLKSLGFETAKIRVVDALEFQGYDCQVNLLKDTFVGNLLDISVQNTDDKIFLEVTTILSSLDVKIMNRSEFGEVLKKINIEDEYVFEKFDVLNDKIKQFSYISGIDIRADSRTLKSRLEAMSNDYSFLEPLFFQVTGTKLLCEESFLAYRYFKPISIIIPSCNSNDKLLFTLLSIQWQNLPKDLKGYIQVIVIDDGSTKPVTQTIKENGTKYDFDLKIIRLEQNSDLSMARNVGIAATKHDCLLFIDSDILLTKNYIMDCIIRMQVIPNALFTSFRRNITRDSELLKDESFKLGLENPNFADDSRIKTTISKDLVGRDELFEAGRSVELLDDTDYFKKLSFGGNIGAYDLPRMLPGHNIAVNKNIVEEVGGFSTEFKGWGLEDRYFAARAVANGNFIIPILSSSVYHIDYGPRDGDMDRKIREFNINFETYKRLLQKEW